MGVMNQLISGATRKQTSSARMSAISDTDDTDDEQRPNRSRRQSNGKKKKTSDKLTRSLPHESIISMTKNSQTSTGFMVDNDKSTSSADPSSSSAGNTTGNNSVAPSTSSGDGSVVKSINQLNKLSEERTNLNQKVQESEEKLAKLQNSVKLSLTPCLSSLDDLKCDLKTFKTKIQSDQQEFLGKMCGGLTDDLVKQVLKMNENRYSSVIKDIESRVRNESESDLDKIRNQLELEQQKLKDCHREIDIYRQQLDQAALEMDKLKTEFIETKQIHAAEKQTITENSDIEKAEIVKKLTLEHEIELDALREELENSERVANCESEVKRLREVLQLKESDVEALRRKTRLMEVNQEEKFHEEKEKIVQILEAGFSQRERLSLQKYEEELSQKFHEKIDLERKNWQEDNLKKLENLKLDQKSEMQIKLSELDKLQKSNIESMVQKATSDLRKKFEQDRENALKTQHQQLTGKAKRDIDALRKRFKMMQTTGALERSPSCSESELSAESPRQDVVDNIRSAIKLEYENSLKMEQNKWERQIQELKEEHEQSLVEMMSREKIRDIADQQVMFNEALNKAMEEKNRQVQELQDQLAVVTTHSEKTNGCQRDSDLVQQLAELGQKNTQLEAELKEAKSKLDQMMTTSVMTLNRSDQDPDLQRLQKENAHLKEQLTKSMLVLVSSGKINVASVDRGDIVMVVWNEAHNNFSIYTEPCFDLPLHFLHNESTHLLGLSIPPNNASKIRYTSAEVVDKEYCQAKKSENRFRVPQGTKFYRVRCKPATIKDKDIMTKSNGKND